MKQFIAQLSFCLCYALVLGVAVGECQSIPSITNITNAALPELQEPREGTRFSILTSRSMATIFGTNLSNVSASAAPPWKKTLGGIEVHLLYDSPCGAASCDVPADLIYVSPTQINFVIPEVGPFAHPTLTLYKNAIPYVSPIKLSIDDTYWATRDIVFPVGYDCLYSFSLTDPGACGLSWRMGQHREKIGAITDERQQLITKDNPVYQGRMMTLWMTSTPGLRVDGQTGLRQGAPYSFYFGVAQNGKDFPSTLQNGSEGPFPTLQTPKALWIGESPEYPGLDQASLNFLTCPAKAKATVEKRYDAFLLYYQIETGTRARIYIPFVVRPGDPDCQF